MAPHDIDDPETLHALLDHAQDQIVVVDDEGVYRYVNEAVERILGYAPAEFVGRNAFDHVHPEDRECITSAFEVFTGTEDERVETAEYRHRAADGSWVWLESRLLNYPISDPEGYVVSSRNITDRKRAERQHRETETRLRQLAENTNDVLWMFTADWEELLFVNEAYEDIWGQPIPGVEADARKFLDGVHPEDRPRVVEAMDRLSAGESIDLEYRVNPGLEFRRWVWVKGSPIVEDGDVTRIVGFARDITDRRRRERQLRVMDNLLRHNLRNDMNVILGHAELCSESADLQVADCMDVILETGTDLLETAEKEREIVDVLVDIGGRQVLDLSAIVDDVVETTRERHPEATVTVDAVESIDVIALPDIRRALEELLDNAIEHTVEAPTVEVDLRSSTDGVELEVRDNAPPIPDNEFEPLAGEDEPNEVYHATGLGLWLVYWIVDLSEGDIEFESHTAGNVVTIRLPQAA